jgi:hypothetical protein
MAVSVVTPLDQFFDNNGDPLNSGTVTVQDAGTGSLRNIYTDTALTITATNPIPLDSAGRPSQGMVYTAAGAYKLQLKDSAENLVGQVADNIDPGIPLGTGILGLANGGTGGNDAASARASLGAVGTSDIEDLEAQVAALAGAAGSSERTGIAVGTTAQRPAVPAVGDVRYNSTTSAYEFYTGSGWQNPYYTDSFLAGTVVKSAYTEYTTNGTTTDQIAYDDSIPQSSEGLQIISTSFTPTNASNKLRFRFTGMFSLTGAGTGVCALFSGASAGSVAASATRADSNDSAYQFNLVHEEVAGVTTSKTFAIRVGPGSAVTLSLNGTSAARRLGGVAKCVLIIEEVKV